MNLQLRLVPSGVATGLGLGVFVTDNRFRFRLPFALITCGRCGVRRIRSVPCADCGAQPAEWEIDHQVTKRRAAATSAIGLLNRESEFSGQLTGFELAQFSERLLHWMPEFFSAAKATSEGAEGAEVQLSTSVKALAEERALLSFIPRRNPWGAHLDGAQACVGHMIEMVRSYLCALGAAAPLEAQRHADDAQRHLNDADSSLDGWLRATELLESLLNSGELKDRLIVLLKQAMADLGVSNLLEIDSAAEGVLQLVTGDAPGPRCGVGLHFALQDAAASVYGNRDRFRTVVKESYALLSQDRGALSALAASTHFLSDLDAALLELFDAFTLIEQMSSSSAVPRQVGRSLSDAAASLVEGSGQLISASLLLTSGRKTRPYDKLRDDNATELIRAARNHADLESLLFGFNTDLRTAQAHRMLRYDDLGVTATIKSGQHRFTWEVLFDELVSATMSAMGGLVGLIHALSRE